MERIGSWQTVAAFALLAGVACAAVPQAGRLDRPSGTVTVCYVRGIVGEAYDPRDMTAKVKVFLKYPAVSGRTVVRQRTALARGKGWPGITMPGHAFRFYGVMRPGTPVALSAQTRDGRTASLGAFFVSTDSASVSYDTTTASPSDPPSDETTSEAPNTSAGRDMPPEDAYEEDPIDGIPPME